MVCRKPVFWVDVARLGWSVKLRTSGWCVIVSYDCGSGAIVTVLAMLGRR